MKLLITRTLALAVSLAVSHATTQNPPPQFKAAVDLMRIEVTVLDKRTRKPVRGLTAADFLVKVNGEAQELEALDEVEVVSRDAARVAPFVEAARDVVSNALANPRLFVIVMDDALASREGFAKKKGKDIAHAVVNGLGPNDLAAIVFAQDNRHAQDFTADRVALRKAIETYDPKPLGPMGQIMSVSVLERSSAFLRRMPGYRRAVVWITLGPGGADLEYESLVTWEPRPPQELNVSAAEGAAALARATDKVLAGGRVAAVPVYAYSLVGLGPVTVSETKGAAMPSPFGNPAMDRIATTTGGRQIYNTNAPDAEVPAMFAELSSYYAIAFRTSFPMDGKMRRLEVDVKRPDVIIAPPDTSFTTPKELTAVGAASRVGAPLGLVEALSGPLPRGEVRLLLGSVPILAVSHKENVVALTVGIPTAAGANRQKFALSVLVYDGEGLREILKQSQTVTVQPQPDTAAQLTEVAIPLTLRPGRYLVRVAVAETATGASGSVYTTVVVPDFSNEPLTLSGVAIGRAEGRPIGGREAIEPFLPFAPTVSREFSPSDHVGALVRVHQATGRPLVVRLDTQILDASGAVAVSQSTSLVISAFRAGTGVEHRYELPLKTLAPGEYLLRFAATSEGRHVTREVRFALK
jgi:VWFA-related protein